MPARSVLNRSAVKQYALESQERYHKFTRVSKEFLDYLEGRVLEIIKNTIFHLPTKGKTIYPPLRLDSKKGDSD